MKYLQENIDKSNTLNRKLYFNLYDKMNGILLKFYNQSGFKRSNYAWIQIQLNQGSWIRKIYLSQLS